MRFFVIVSIYLIPSDIFLFPLLRHGAAYCRLQLLGLHFPFAGLNPTPTASKNSCCHKNRKKSPFYLVYKINWFIFVLSKGT